MAVLGSLGFAVATTLESRPFTCRKQYVKACSSAPPGTRLPTWRPLAAARDSSEQILSPLEFRQGEKHLLYSTLPPVWWRAGKLSSQPRKASRFPLVGQLTSMEIQ